MKPSQPQINEKKCKGCDVIMKREDYRDSYRFRIKKFHSIECRKSWDKKNGGYGYGNLEEV